MLVKKNPLYWEFTYLKHPFTRNLCLHPLIVQPIGAVKNFNFCKIKQFRWNSFSLWVIFIEKIKIYKKTQNDSRKTYLDEFPYFFSDPLREIIKIFTFSYAYSHRPVKKQKQFGRKVPEKPSILNGVCSLSWALFIKPIFGF